MHGPDAPNTTLRSAEGAWPAMEFGLGCQVWGLLLRRAVVMVAGKSVRNMHERKCGRKQHHEYLLHTAVFWSFLFRAKI